MASGREPSGLILLAEDQPVNQRVATAMLENLGFAVDVVADGAGAVRAAILTPYRAILMDCQIPVLDGYRATGEIRRLQGASGRTPIIAVTGSATPADRERCLAAGMDDYLTKPLRVEALAAMLARWASGGSVPAGVVRPIAALPSDRVDPAVAVDLAHPVLDAQVVGRLERLGDAAGEDLMGQLTTMFLADADAWVVALREGLAGDDAVAVHRSAHTLSGASANLGATDLARLCASLATDGGAGDLVHGGARLGAIEAELGRVRSALISRRTAS
jgi:CheY-like chemotaxis protein/HPt (histidine-containing phosphotransfer) domain-containing protein